MFIIYRSVQSVVVEKSYSGEERKKFLWSANEIKAVVRSTGSSDYAQVD